MDSEHWAVTLTKQNKDEKVKLKLFVKIVSTIKTVIKSSPLEGVESWTLWAPS